MLRKILIADDNHPNRILVQTYLKNFGFECTTATNGIEAVNAVRSTAFDLVLMDIQMPRMDGLEATRKIREFPPPRGNVPILALTASAVDETKKSCFDAGMNGVVSKPIIAANLYARITAEILTGED